MQKPDLQADGLKALDEQRYTEAAEIFAKAIAADPKDFSAHFNLALAFTFLKKDQDAIAEYRKVLELKPAVYQAELNLGQVLLRNKQAAEALPLLESAAKAKPDQFRPLFYAGEAALATGAVDQAEDYYNRASAIDPKNAATQLGLGQIAMKRNKLEEAETHIRKAIELDPSYKDSLLELASAYEAKKDVGKAASLYKEFPDNPAARERVGSLLLESGDAAKAIEELKAAVAHSPTSANRYALAMAYVKNRELDKAEPLLAKAVQDEPANAELRMSFGRVLRDEKKYNLAAMEFYRVAQAKTDSVEAWSELAGMLVLLQKDAEAIAALDKLRSMGAEKPGHLFIRAIVLDRNKQIQPAIESYEKFLELDGGKSPDEEFKARQRVRILKRELAKK
jgi:Tfp pilus assembly protein PilF